MGLEPGTSRVVAFSDVPSDGFRVGVEKERELGIYTRVLSCMSASLSLATKSIIDDYVMPRSRAATEVRNHRRWSRAAAEVWKHHGGHEPPRRFGTTNGGHRRAAAEVWNHRRRSRAATEVRNHILSSPPLAAANHQHHNRLPPPPPPPPSLL